MIINKKIDYSILFFISFLMAISFGQLSRLQFHSLTLYVHDLIIVLAILTHLLTKSVFKPLHIEQKNTKWILLVLGGWLLIGWIRANFEMSLSLAAPLTALRLITYSLFTLSISHKIYSCSTLTIRGMVFLTTLLMTSWGILQYLFLPDVRFLHTFGWDDHYYRLIGPLLDPNFAGLLSVITLYYWQSLQVGLRTIFGTKYPFAIKYLFTIRLFVWVVTIVALGMTFSRSSWLAFGGSLFFLSIWPKAHQTFSLKIVSGWLVGLLAVYMLLPKPTGEGVDITRTSTITARSTASQQQLANWQPLDWIIGKGAFNVRLSLPTKGENVLPNTANQPDNLLIQILGSVGIGGMLLLLWLVWATRKFWQKLDVWLIGALVATLIHAQFNNSLFQPQIWLILMAGMARPLLPPMKKTTV